MTLKFPGRWRFTPPPDGKLKNASIPAVAVAEVIDLIHKVATQGNRQDVLEHFKQAFCDAGRQPYAWSSSIDWTETDLLRAAEDAARNAPLFIEAFFEACSSFAQSGEDLFAPDAPMINELLTRYEIGYEIHPPHLVPREAVASAQPSPVPQPFLPQPPSSSASYAYDVALSFAGEDREYVDRVANALKAAGVKVFYDTFEKATLWGVNLGDHLAEVYGKLSRFVVIFVSQHYARKAWPNHERQHAQARAIRESSVVILPARFDETEVPGLASTVGYIKLGETSPEELAEVIVAKLK